MGNAAVTIRKKYVEGGRRKLTADVTLSTSYATNGDTVVAADIAAINMALGLPERSDLSGVEVADCEMGSDGTSLYIDRTNKKVKAFSGRAEVANATNLNVTPGAIRVELCGPAVTG